jgi:hypothetical protein
LTTGPISCELKGGGSPLSRLRRLKASCPGRVSSGLDTDDAPPSGQKNDWAYSAVSKRLVRLLTLRSISDACLAWVTVGSGSHFAAALSAIV